jgi:hypothetical protein
MYWSSAMSADQSLITALSRSIESPPSRDNYPFIIDDAPAEENVSATMTSGQALLHNDVMETPDEPHDNRAPEITGTIGSLIPDHWFKDPAHSSVWMRVYTCLFAPLDVVTAAIKEWPSAARDGTEHRSGRVVMFAVGTVADFKTLVQTTEIFARVSGQVEIATHISERVLPDAIFVFFATPYVVDDATFEQRRLRLLDQQAKLPPQA